MPNYLFSHPRTGKVKEVFFRMNDENKRYIDDNGTEWERIFSIPQAAVDTKYDPFSSKDFLKHTENKKGCYGDVQDLAKEASFKRQERAGVDPLKQKYYESYAKKTKGKEHPDLVKRRGEEKLKKLSTDFDISI